MKLFYTRLCVVALISVCAVVAQGQSIFTSVFHQPTFHDLHSIVWADSLTMYAVGDGASFVRTTNGGTSFDVITVSNEYETLLGGDFANAQVGAVCGANGLVGITTNGGTNWVTRRVPGAGQLIDVKLNVATLSGFVTGVVGIFSTTDLGQSWTKVYTVQVDTAQSRQDSMFASVRLNATTYLAITNNQTELRSSDGGMHWDSIAKIPGTAPTAIYFLNDKDGWIVNNPYNVLTTDGGTSWDGSFGAFSTVTVTSLYYTDTKHGWALAHKASGAGIISDFYYTTDGGSNFLYRKGVGNGISALTKVLFSPSISWGWAVGDVADIHKTTTPGNDTLWKTLSSGQVGPTSASSFFDEDHGIVCTEISGAGYLYATTNSGQSWTPAHSGENPDYCVRMIDAQHAIGLFETAKGYHHYTSNGGAQWGPGKSFPETGANSGHLFNRIFDLNSSVLFACGAQGLVIMSTDSGLSWTDSPSITDVNYNFHDYFGLAFKDNSLGFLCGNGGTLLKTTNSGSSWAPVIIQGMQDATFTDIAFASTTSGWMTTDQSGTVMHTNNGGATWDSVYIGAHGKLNRVVFASDKLGWISGIDGQLFMTRDDGGVWQKISTGTLNSIDDISYVPRTANPTKLWISGGYAMVLKGDLSLVGVSQTVSTLPGAFSLGAAYPNPFTTMGAQTSVPFTVASETNARLEVVNIMGQVVRTISRGEFAAGEYTGIWDGRDAYGMQAPAGVYFFSLSSGASRVTKSFVVTR